MSPTEHVTSVANSAIGAMRSTPLAIALLAVNCAFLGVATYVLGEVAENSRERNKTQVELITTLVKDCKK